MKKWLVIGLMFAWISSGMLRAQNVEAYARLDSTSIMIGDQIGLEVGIQLPESFAVLFPMFTDTLSRHIEILEKSEIDTLPDEGGYLMRQNYLITSFDSGYFRLPDFEFLFHHIDDTVLYSSTPAPMYLMVNVPEVDTTQAFKVIKGPMEEPYTFMEIFPWVLLGLAIIGGIIFLIWYVRKRKQNKPLFRAKPKPVLPPDVLALQKIEELRLAKVWQQGRLKDYYTQLTDIAREYFEGRYRFEAMEMTSDEIMVVLKNHQVNDEAYGKMKEVLQLADLVKFAKAHPTPLENDLCLSHCEDFVRETRPVPETKETEENKNREPVKEESKDV
jgi:hypothetical protein